MFDIEKILKKEKLCLEKDKEDQLKLNTNVSA
jgi:hypothetical protein